MSNWVLKNNDTNEEIEIDQDMQWDDELGWSKIAQANPVYTLGGSVEVQQGTKKAGRQITLLSEKVWITRKTLLTLREWSDTPELKMTLTHYNGDVYVVIFRLHEKAIDAKPVLYTTPEEDDAPYFATINLMEVKA